MSIPNSLSLFRLLGSPLMLPLSTWPDRRLIVGWFVLLGLSDCLDGALARRWNQVTEFGSKLDGIADLVFYPCAAVVLAMLFPTYLVPNLPWIAFTFAALVAVLIASWWKCGRIILLHTHLSRFAGVVVFFAVLASFFVDTTLLIRAVALLYTLSFLEGIAIFTRFGAVSPDRRSYFSRTSEG